MGEWYIMKEMKHKAFTLMELLIVVSVMAVLFAGLILLINPITIINRGNDVARKKDLDDAKKMLEEYMADTGCYPQPTQICINGSNTSPCNICTKQQSAQFSYFAKDICDPKQGGSLHYLYKTETVLVPGIGYEVTACPKWFYLFSVLDSAYIAADDPWGCKKGGCGVSPSYGYSYVVTSPGAPTDAIASVNWYCYLSQFDRCVQCTPYENCTSQGNACYGKDLYPVRSSCCSANGLPPC